MQNALKRRTFLQLLGVMATACGGSDPQETPAGNGGAAGASGAAGTSGAAGEAGAAGSPQKPELGGLWELIEEMKQGVAGSPDNLPAIAAGLVADKDAPAIFAFVRDRISTVPFTDGYEPGYNGQAERLLWGPGATLRSGAGSPRDKVELLKDLLTQAGFSAKVVNTSYAPAEAEIAAHFERKETPAFSMKVDQERIDAWVEHVGLAPQDLPKEGTPAVDPAGAEATALADELLAQIGALPAELSAQLIWYGPTPAVSAEINGKTELLQPLRPGAMFGEQFGEVNGDAPAAQSAPVRVAIEGNWSDNLYWEKMVEGTWQEHELAGRQVLFSAMPLVPAEVFLQSTIRDLDTFVPFLGVQAPDQPLTPFLKEHTVPGEAFSLGGETITAEDDGTVRVNGVRIHEPGKTGPIEQVASVEVLASGVQFPKVRLRVRALDATGKPVLGLGPAAFAVSEDGRKRPTLVRANQPARRVLVLIDASGSMPPEYRDEQGEALMAGIQNDLLALDPTLEITTQYTSSDLWTNLATGADANPGAIVFITDGDTTDAKTAAIEAALKVSPKAFLINVYQDLNPELTEMASLTGGAVVTVTSPEEARQQAVGFLKDTPAPDYTLTYEAPIKGEATRAVAVAINQKSGTGSYTVPAPEERLPSRRLIGLRMVVEMGGQTVQRHLFGYDGIKLVEAADVERLSEQIRANLRSTVAVSFDGERPLTSVLAAEGLEFISSYRPALDASQGADLKKTLDAFKQGGMVLPPGQSLLRTRAPEALLTRTSTGGLRATLHQRRLTMDNDGNLFEQPTSDIFPIFRLRTAGVVSPQDAFRATLRASAHTAVLESRTFKTSTVSELAGKKLKMAAPDESVELPAGMDEAKKSQLTRLLDQYSTHYRLYAEDGSSAALWLVHRQTGELLGLLGDGSGGAKGDIQAATAKTNNALAIVSMIATALGASPGLGLAFTWASLMITLYGTAAIIIETMDASTLGPELEKAVAGTVLSAYGALLTHPAAGVAWGILCLALGQVMPG